MIHKLTFDAAAGKTYEDRYSGWLDFFRRVATDPLRARCRDVPLSWVPLLLYLGASVESALIYFPQDRLMPSLGEIAQRMGEAGVIGLAREYVEMCCALRPELVDAMWKSDCEWDTLHRQHTMNTDEFVITNNGSFHRPEVLDFITKMRIGDDLEMKHGIVLVPCAADKPYPSPLHKDVRAHIPDSYRIAVVTGVLGVVPEEYWPEMPKYDSGVPNRWRAMKLVEEYFTRYRWSYRHIVVYSDFYSEAIRYGLEHAGIPTDSTLEDRRAEFPLEDAGVWTRGANGYTDLRLASNLALLHECVGGGIQAP